MSSHWRIARVAGVDLLVSPTVLFMGAVLAFLFAQRASSLDENPVVLGVGYVLGLYVSVLVHEIAHVVAARSYGLHVPTVTLHMLGGETAIEGRQDRPLRSLVIAIVGPLASAAIGVVCLGVRDSTSGTTYLLLSAVGFVNLLVAVFNLIPGLPLDGGQVLKALIWMVTGSERTGTVVAAWIGRVTAVGVGVWALTFFDDPDGTVRIVIAGIVAFFLWTGATSALRWTELVDRIDALAVRDLMRHEPPPPGLQQVPVELTGRDLVDVLNGSNHHFYAVTDRGTEVGLLAVSDVQAAVEGRV